MKMEPALAQGKLGTGKIFYLTMAPVAPFIVVGGIVTAAYAATGIVSIPLVFLAVLVLLRVFTSGYLAMQGDVPSAAPFFTMNVKGLGRPLGLGAWLTAVMAYNCFQVAAYGALGFFMNLIVPRILDIDIPWFCWAGVAWATVLMLGLLNIDVGVRVLGLLGTAEVIVVLALAGIAFAHPAHGHYTLTSLDPSHLTWGTFAVAVVIAITGYVGFETSAVYSEEAKRPRRTIPRALIVALVGSGLVYALFSVALQVYYGSDLIAVAQSKDAQGPPMVLGIGGLWWLTKIAGFLFVTSVFAGLLAFHMTVARYVWLAGREGTIPKVFATTSKRGAPIVASLTQSVIGIAVISVYAANHWDPLIQLFFYIAAAGSFGILVLYVVTSISAIRHFWRRPDMVSTWSRLIAPGLFAVVGAAILVAVIQNYHLLMGVDKGSPITRFAPVGFGVLFIVGAVWAALMRLVNRTGYQHIGLGTRIATALVEENTQRISPRHFRTTTGGYR